MNKEVFELKTNLLYYRLRDKRFDEARIKGDDLMFVEHEFDDEYHKIMKVLNWVKTFCL